MPDGRKRMAITHGDKPKTGALGTAWSLEPKIWLFVSHVYVSGT